MPRIEQAVLTAFITGGHYERHINKTRKIYKTRHDALISALKGFGNKVCIMGENAGMHLVVRFNYRLTEKELMEVAERLGIKVAGLSKHRIGKEDANTYLAALLIGYGNISEENIKEGIGVLKKELDNLDL